METKDIGITLMVTRSKQKGGVKMNNIDKAIEINSCIFDLTQVNQEMLLRTIVEHDRLIKALIEADCDAQDEKPLNLFTSTPPAKAKVGG